MPPRRGSPPIPVRATEAKQTAWREAAQRAGMDFSGWVRATLDRAANLTEETLKADVERTIANIRGINPPSPHAATPDTCPHPKDRRRRMSYGTVCDACGRMLP